MFTPRHDIPPDLEDEVTSLNAIYASNTLSILSNPGDAIQLVLSLPQTPLSLLLNIPWRYPSEPPVIDRVTHIDEALPKGYGNRVLESARDVLSKLSTEDAQAGQPILYELIEALEASIAEKLQVEVEDSSNIPTESVPLPSQVEFPFIPDWTLSEPLQSHKSTFLARACPVSSPDECHSAIGHLLANDKRAAKATHNMWAYRIRGTPASSSSHKGNEVVVYSDADDDGEDGAGAKLASLLQSMAAWGVLVVVSRWYGGVKLGPERWRLIGSVGREAVVKGGEEGRWLVEKT